MCEREAPETYGWSPEGGGAHLVSGTNGMGGIQEKGLGTVSGWSGQSGWSGHCKWMVWGLEQKYECYSSVSRQEKLAC